MIGPSGIGLLVAVAGIAGAAAGAWAGGALYSSAPTWGLAWFGLALVSMPAALFATVWRRRRLGWLLLWLLSAAFSFMALVPVCAGISRSLASSGAGRRLLLLTSVALCWTTLILPPVLSAYVGPARGRLRAATIRVALSTVLPIGLGVAVLPAVLSAMWPSPAWLVAAVAVATFAILGRAGDASYTAWLARHRQDPPVRLLRAIAEITSLCGRSFDQYLTLPTGWPDPVCEVRTWRGRRCAVVITAGLVDRLSDTELEALLAHEVEHVLAGDLAAARGLAAGVSFAVVILALQLMELLGASLAWHMPLVVAVAASMSMLRSLVQLFDARRRERHADDFAAALVGAEALGSALSKLSETMPTHDATIWSTHDSVRDRLRRLR